MTERDAAIREAYASGVIQSDIADILGISQQLVSQVLRAGRGRQRRPEHVTAASSSAPNATAPS